MDLQELNKKYEHSKQKYETLNSDKAKLQQLQIAIVDAKRKLEDMKDENLKAEILGNKKPYDKKALEQANKDYQQAYDALKNYRGEVQEALEKVNTKFKELTQDSEMKQYLDEVVATRMGRSIKTSEKRLDSYKEIKTILEKHPHANNLVKGLINSRREVTKLEGKLEKLQKSKAPDNKIKEAEQELTDARTALENRKSNVEVFLDKNYPDILPETKENLLNLNTNIDTAIKGEEKRIAQRRRAYQMVTGQEYKKQEPTKGVNEGREEGKTGNLGQGNNELEGEALPPAKLPWYKRLARGFKNWFYGEEYMKPEPEQKSEEKSEEKSDAKRSDKKFKDAYKYDIVKEYVEKAEKEAIKKARSQEKMDRKKENDKEPEI